MPKAVPRQFQVPRQFHGSSVLQACFFKYLVLCTHCDLARVIRGQRERWRRALFFDAPYDGTSTEHHDAHHHLLLAPRIASSPSPSSSFNIVADLEGTPLLVPKSTCTIHKLLETLGGGTCMRPVRDGRNNGGHDGLYCYDGSSIRVYEV